MKTWTLREGEVRKPGPGEWIREPLSGEFIHAPKWASAHPCPILTLTVHEEDPMKGIRAVYEKWIAPGKFSNLAANEMWAAIKKAVEGE